MLNTIKTRISPYWAFLEIRALTAWSPGPSQCSCPLSWGQGLRKADEASYNRKEPDLSPLAHPTGPPLSSVPGQMPCAPPRGEVIPPPGTLANQQRPSQNDHQPEPVDCVA